jgi:hypothetical protein
LTAVDTTLDDALHDLGPLGAAAVVVCFGSSLGIAQRTHGYADRYGWREVVINPVATEIPPDQQIEAHGLDHIEVLHIETKRRDWRILKEIDLQRFRPRIIRLRRTSLIGADLFLTVRHLARQGYRVEWFYDELIGLLLPPETAEAPAAQASTAPVAAAAPAPDRAALYVISYNSPDQFRLWLESVERANPELLACPARFLLDNSTDPETRPGYDRLCDRYGFTVLRHGNLGITGGRLFCARHFDALPQCDALYWFEDDMLLHAPEAPPCRNGLRAHVPGLLDVVTKIARRESLDFIKLSFTEFFGDHHLNWAWYHISPQLRESAFPDGTFRTRIQHSGVESGVSYIVGDVHFDNWPTYMTRRGNAQIFLAGNVPEPWEGCYMARGFELQHHGDMRAGALLASPINHCRTYHYPREERREF